MLDPEKQASGVPMDAYSDRPPSRSAFYAVSARLKHFFPLTKPRVDGTVTPTIVTTSPTSDSLDSLVPRERGSESTDITDASARTSASTRETGGVMGAHNASQTHFHVVSSSAVAAAIAVNRIHFDDTISIRSSYERSSSRAENVP